MTVVRPEPLAGTMSQLTLVSIAMVRNSLPFRCSIWAPASRAVRGGPPAVPWAPRDSTVGRRGRCAAPAVGPRCVRRAPFERLRRSGGDVYHRAAGGPRAAPPVECEGGTHVGI